MVAIRTILWSLLGIYATLSSGSALSQDAQLRLLIGGEDICYASRAQQESRESALGVLSGALLSAAASHGIPLLSSYFEKLATSTSSETRMAFGSTELYNVQEQQGKVKVTGNLRCLVVANGVIGLASQENSPWLTRERVESLDRDAVFINYRSGKPDVSVLERLGFVDIPLSYYEFRFVYHPFSNSVRLEPSYIFFRESLAASRKLEAKTIEITLTLLNPTSTGSL